jgi:IclR family acetate operon transcriptional repressor
LGADDVLPQASGIPGRVQSVDRALDLLELLADGGGMLGLSDLAVSSGLPVATVHRLLRALARRGYVRQEQSRVYALGPGLIHLGEVASQLLGPWLQPCLGRLTRIVGETSILAMLDGDEIVYVAEAPGTQRTRALTERGRRASAHSTAVGKALLAQLPVQQTQALLERTGMPSYTPRTVTDPGTLLAQLELIRGLGYAVDEGEQEVGVRCFAVAIPRIPIGLALSVAGPESHITDDAAASIVPVLSDVAAEISAAFTAKGATE